MQEIIYVAGPLTSNNKETVIKNVKKAKDISVVIRQLGHHFYLPHLLYYLNDSLEDLYIEWSYEDYLEIDFFWLRKCTSLFYIGKSPGTDRELKLAKASRKKIYYSLEEIKPC